MRNSHAKSNPNSYSYCNSNCYSYCYRYTRCHSDTNCHTNIYAPDDADAAICANTEKPSHSAPEATVSLGTARVSRMLRVHSFVWSSAFTRPVGAAA